MTDTPTLHAKPREVATPWRWRSATGEMAMPSEMETRHLFYTLRMIWNHSCPPEAVIGERVRRYRFGPQYSPEYMAEAVRHIWAELRGRSDLTPWQRAELDEMHRWFAAAAIKEIAHD